MKRGAIHQPDNPAVRSARDFAEIRVGGAAPVDWFATWNCPPDNDILGNDALSCCVPIADLRMIQLWLAARGAAWPIPRELVTLRYAATGGYQGTPATDNGTVTQADCFAWQAAPIVANGESWPIGWAIVRPSDVSAALRRGPLALTLGLTAIDADDPDLWQHAPAGPYVDYHRVVAGAADGGLLKCRTYGFDRWVSPARIVGADLLIHLDAPPPLRMAGIDWAAFQAAETPRC